jgi:hypothetical protein
VNLELLRLVDAQFLETPWYGSGNVSKRVGRVRSYASHPSSSRPPDGKFAAVPFAGSNSDPDHVFHVGVILCLRRLQSANFHARFVKHTFRAPQLEQREGC